MRKLGNGVAPAAPPHTDGGAAFVSALRPAPGSLPSGADLLRPLLAGMAEGVVYCRMLFDEAGRPTDYLCLEVNPAFEALTGLRDSVSRPISEVVPGIHEANPELLEAYARVARTGVPERLEAYVRGLARWFSISVFRPEPGHFVAVFENSTLRRRTEEALRDSDRRYQTVVEGLAEGVVVQDASGEIVASNALIRGRARRSRPRDRRPAPLRIRGRRHRATLAKPPRQLWSGLSATFDRDARSSGPGRSRWMLPDATPREGRRSESPEWTVCVFSRPSRRWRIDPRGCGRVS